MICATCAAENKTGRLYCASCGAALSQECGVCGFANEPRDAFCGGCGQALGQKVRAPDVAAERRPVSILFADLVGYTALSQKIDPEDTHALLARFFAVADEIILQFGGSIDKHMGDNVMALFGAPIAHGDDPQRAVGAAQAIHAAMPALSKSTGQPLSVHVGIAVGDVLASGLGSVAHSSYTVVGQAVNLAARLMNLAAPGETLVSSEIARHLDHRFELEPLGEKTIKGLPVPISAFRIGAALNDKQRGQRPLVGRRAEIAQIDALLKESRKEGKGHSLVIRGVPGIGKTRLLEEAAQHARRRGFKVVILRVLDFGAGTERDPHRQLAQGLIASGAGPDALEPLQSALFAQMVGRPLNLDEQRRIEAMSHVTRHAMRAEALAAMITSTAARQAVLILIEDIHWADTQFLTTLATLTDRVASIRAMLLMTSRIDPDPIDAAWRARLRQGHVVTVDLAPLTEVDALEMSRQIAPDVDQFARQCVARAEGNPLFLEQLLRNQPGGDISDLPNSLQSVVLARLDQLPEGDKAWLQAASILGQQFSGEDLEVLLDRPNFNPETMLRRQLLRPVPGGFLFAHALIHDGIYSALTKERRRTLHRKAASLYAGRDAILRAEHLDRAEAPEAALAYLDAAQAEGRQHHLDQSARLAARGLELARGEAVSVLGLEAGRRHLDIGAAAVARIAFSLTLEAAISPDDRCRALVGLAACDRQLGNIESALQGLSEAEPLSADDDILLAEIHYLRGNLHFARGDGEACHDSHSKALIAAKRTGSVEWLARAESGLGDAFYMQGRYARALEHFRACTEIAAEAGLLRILPTNRAMIGNCNIFQCRFDDALHEVKLAREEALLIGDRFGDMFGLECLAFIQMAACRWPEAAISAEASLNLAVEIGARRYESITAAILAMSRYDAGDTKGALDLITRALRIAEETGLGFAGALIEAIRAIIMGPCDAARAILDYGESLLRQTSMAHSHLFFRAFAIDWAIAAGEWDRVTRYADDLAKFTAAEPLPYTDMIVERARLLAAYRRDPSDERIQAATDALAAKADAVDFRLDFPTP
jgi:class 3 adenylate cyclase/tetratricopeptide (TPR) repeat protein